MVALLLLAAGAGAAAGPLGAQQLARADSVYDPEDVERRPELIPNSCQAPTYPIMARNARLEGRVLIQGVLDTLGRLEAASLEVVQSSFTVFNDNARRAVETCRFRPAMTGGRPVRVRLLLPIAFRLER